MYNGYNFDDDKNFLISIPFFQIVQFPRGETKRALLPNEITVLDTVKALFVRSFGRMLTMEYMDSPRLVILMSISCNSYRLKLQNCKDRKTQALN